MKTQEEINEWLENLPKSEKAKMMFQIKKNESLDNEEIKKKIRLADDNIDDAFSSEIKSKDETKNRIKLSEATAEDIEKALEGIDDVFGTKIKIDDIDVINENTSSHKKLIDNNIEIIPSYEVFKPKKKNIFKEILLSVLYMIVAPIFNLLIYFSIFWFLENIVIDSLNWFNLLNFWIKIILISLGIGIFFGLILNLGTIFINIVNILIWKIFPINIFTQIIAFLLAIYNIVYLIWGFKKLVPYWNLLYKIEFIIIVFLIISINTVLVPHKRYYN